MRRKSENLKLQEANINMSQIDEQTVILTENTRWFHIVVVYL